MNEADTHRERGGEGDMRQIKKYVKLLQFNFHSIQSPYSASASLSLALFLINKKINKKQIGKPVSEFLCVSLSLALLKICCCFLAL